MSENNDPKSMKSFFDSFNKPLMYIGSANSYVAIAECPSSKLAMAIEVGTSMVPVHSIPTQVIGIGFRLIEVGERAFSDHIPKLRQGGSHGSFKNSESGEHEEGFRLIKTFLPIMSFPCDPAYFRQYTDSEVFPQLLAYVEDLCKKTEGKLLTSSDELLEAMIQSVAKFDENQTEPLKLFTLPGVKPAWVDDPKPKPVQPGHSPFGEGDDPEHDEDDEEE